MTERFDRYRPMALDDPDRPLRINKTVEAVVPAAARRFLKHEVDEVTTQEGEERIYHRITLPEGVMVTHVDPLKRITLVQQYRHAIGRDSDEIPSGGAEPYEQDALEVASEGEKEMLIKKIGTRETEEETGWRVEPDQLHRMYKGPFQGSVGFAYQTYHLFHAEGGIQTKQKLDETETGITIVHPHLDEAVEMLGHEIVELASSLSIVSLARIYDQRSDNLRAYQRQTTRLGALLRKMPGLK